MQIEVQSNIAHVVKEGPYIKVVAFYTDNGTPIGGLTPKINLFNLSTGLPVTIPKGVVAGNPVDIDILTEVTSGSGEKTGFYSFSFPPVGHEKIYDRNQCYTFRCDGGGTLNPVDQYKVGTIDAQYNVNFSEKAVVQRKVGIQKQVYGKDFSEYIKGLEFRQSFQVCDSNGALIDLSDVGTFKLTLSNMSNEIHLQAFTTPFLTVEERANVQEKFAAKIFRDPIHPSVFWLTINGEESKFLNAFKDQDIVSITGYFTLGGNEYPLGDSKNPFYSFKISRSSAVFTPRQYGLDKSSIYSV